MFLQVNCPVRLLHAFGDEDVEWKSSMRLLQSLESSQVDLILRKSGNHRLMKPQGSLKEIQHEGMFIKSKQYFKHLVYYPATVALCDYSRLKFK